MKTLSTFISEAQIQKRENYNGVEIIISQRAAEDFDGYSGLSTEHALEFLHKFIDELENNWGPSGSIKMTAELFYSGYAGWELADTSGKRLGYLFYDSNVYGLEDAHQGKGWHFDDRNLSHKFDRKDMDKMSKAAEAAGKKYKPGKVRM